MTGSQVPRCLSERGLSNRSSVTIDTHAAWNILLVKIVAFCFFGAGAFLCVLNFYLSFLRYPLYCIRGRKGQYRHVSGAPILGSLLVVVLLIPLGLHNWARIAAFSLAAIDTGGLHWFFGIMGLRAMKNPGTSRHQR
jgi:hypothetical protein